MKKQFLQLTICTVAIMLVASACNSTPTPDVGLIQTQAASTVEARFTEMADVEPTKVPATQTPRPTETKTPLPSPTNDPSNTKPCFAMTFVSDITIPDGMLVTPGATFTKTWRVRNDGNCVWDPSYVLELRSGDALSDVIEFPLTLSVYPGDSYDFSIPMTAPTDIGVYTGYWAVKTPYGGYMGVGSYNQNLKVQIEVSEERKLDDSFDAVSVEYDYSKRPANGCGSDGVYYDFKAKIIANGPGKLEYRWDRNPNDGSFVGGTLNYNAAGSQTVYWTWHMTMDHIMGIDRSVWITTISPGGSVTSFPPVLFYFDCK